MGVEKVLTRTEYLSGVYDIWNAMNEVSNMSYEERSRVFINRSSEQNSLGNILSDLSPEELINILDRYYKKLEFGDEVIVRSRISDFDYSSKGIVVSNNDNEYLWIIFENEEHPQKLTKEYFIIEKTGRHVDLFNWIDEFRNKVRDTRTGKIEEEYLMIADLMKKKQLLNNIAIK